MCIVTPPTVEQCLKSTRCKYSRQVRQLLAQKYIWEEFWLGFAPRNIVSFTCLVISKSWYCAPIRPCQKNVRFCASSPSKRGVPSVPQTPPLHFCPHFQVQHKSCRHSLLIPLHQYRQMHCAITVNMKWNSVLTFISWLHISEFQALSPEVSLCPCSITSRTLCWVLTNYWCIPGFWLPSIITCLSLHTNHSVIVLCTICLMDCCLQPNALAVDLRCR